MKHLKDKLVRYVLLITTWVLSLLFGAAMWLSPWWGLGLIISLPLALIALYDYFQKQWTLTRIYPLAARLRWLFYDLRPYLRAYIVEGDLEGKPFSQAARDLVFQRARGQSDTLPFGTERDPYSDEYEWMNHSINPEEHPERHPKVKVGNEQCSAPYETSILNISAMSFGALSAKAVETLNKAARMGNFYQDTGEGGISRYHRIHGGDLVWELGTGYFGCRDRHGNFDPGLFHEQASSDQVKMTEIKLSQGAKPGHGGLLPGKKVTEEIAQARQVEAHRDCQSPRGHPAFSTPIGMLEFAQRMRELSGGKPVGIKLCIGQVHEVMAIMKAMLKTGIHLDFIVVDGGEGGTGAAPLELADHVGMPLTEGLIVMRNALVGTGLRNKVSLAASGKVYSAATLARNLAIGADWCNAARAFMFSIGCIQAQRCNTDTCPTGVTTQDPSRQRGLIVDVQAERAVRFHERTLHALTDIVGGAGFTHPRELQPYHLVHRMGATDSAWIDRIYPFLPENALLEAPEETHMHGWWRAASAHTFKPQIDLATLRASPRPKRHPKDIH